MLRVPNTNASRSPNTTTSRAVLKVAHWSAEPVDHSSLSSLKVKHFHVPCYAPSVARSVAVLPWTPQDHRIDDVDRGPGSSAALDRHQRRGRGRCGCLVLGTLAAERRSEFAGFCEELRRDKRMKQRSGWQLRSRQFHANPGIFFQYTLSVLDLTSILSTIHDSMI